MYPIVYAVLYLLSLLPLRLLLGLSDVITFFLRDVFGYRRQLVLENIRQSFPEKTETEIQKIANEFYRNFTDNWMETIKLLSIGKKKFNKRYQCDYGIVKDAYKTGRPLVVLGAHVFNWEFGNMHFSLHQLFPFLGVYMPISNQTIDRLLRKLRSRFGSHLIKATDIRRELFPWRDKQYAIGLIADQNPGRPENSYWLNFLNRPTPFVRGPERSAITANAIVVYAHMSKVGRGYYACKFIQISNKPQLEPQGELTRKYVRMLEKNIRENPQLYLWSHNRWKAKWVPEYEANWVGETSMPI